MKSLGIYGYYQIRRSDYLKKTGWYRSVNQGKCVDCEGNPIPWMTYPAISFLEKRLNCNMDVFEYGSGASTLWWAKRVKTVISCEHDFQWYTHVSENTPDNVSLFYLSLEPNGVYSKKVSQYPNQFDIIVIDGRDRINCAKNSISALKPNGVLIWDNSDRTEYQEGYDILAKNGFKKLDFEGMCPLLLGFSETSIFYRTSNCLGI